MKNVYLCRSGIAGTGVFALRRFRAGEWILSFIDGAPELVSYNATTRLPEQEANYIQIGIDKYLLPAPPSLYLNHSCDPNTGIWETTEIVALTDIEPGTELTFDYSTSMVEDGWEMNCACGATICRQRIRDFKHLPAERQNYYLARGVVPKFCREFCKDDLLDSAAPEPQQSTLEITSASQQQPDTSHI